MKKLLSIVLAMSMLIALFAMLTVITSADEPTDTFSIDDPKISTAKDLLDFYRALSDGARFLDQTVTIENDIVLNDTTAPNWYLSPTVNTIEFSEGNHNGFRGVFDGKNHTIYGFHMADTYGWFNAVGVLPFVADSTLKNLTLDGFYIKGVKGPGYGDWLGNVAGGLVGYINPGSVENIIDNCTLKNGIITSDAAARVHIGGAVGLAETVLPITAGGDGHPISVTNCVIEDTVKIVPPSEGEEINCGGFIGYIKNGGSNIFNFTGSVITPDKSKGESATLSAVGKFTQQHDFVGNVGFKNLSHGFDGESTTFQAIDKGNMSEYTTQANDKINEIKVYGDSAVSATQYTVTWMIDGVPTEVKFNFGATPSYSGTPTKAETDQYIYRFKGWDSDIVPVSEDVTYTAVFDELKKVRVIWIVDGKNFTEIYGEGDAVSCPLDTDKASDDKTMYTFKGWDKTITVAKEDVTYTAQYEQKTKYKVTWIVGEEKVEEIYLEGATPSFKGNTKKASDEQYSYTFKGWDKELVPVGGDVTYTAQYDKVSKNGVADTEAQTEEKSGCKSTVSFGFATVIAIGMAGAFVARKKED